MNATKTQEKQVPVALSSLDRRIYEALRDEVRALTKQLGETGDALSPALLRGSSERLAEVARFAETFERSGVTSQAVGVKIVEVSASANGHEQPTVAELGAKVAEQRAAGKTWREIAAALAITTSQATYAHRAAKAARKAKRS